MTESDLPTETMAAPTSPSEPFKHVHSSTFAELLVKLESSLLVTTYQAGKLIVVRATREGRLDTLLRSFEQPMGIAVDGARLAIGTRNQIWCLRNAPDIAAQLDPKDRHDSCFLPRLSYVTGDVRGHEMAWFKDDLWFVNTRFSCLCTLHSSYSFIPRWTPPFVTELAAEDRCHLNGLALDSAGPKYVTALGDTNTEEGWRQNKAQGGCLIDVPSGQVAIRGLSMPHSPRIHDGKVWLLESGRGRLLRANPESGSFEAIAQMPGYARGMAFAGNYAFIGLSKIRETSMFGGLPIAENPELKCGVWVVDLRNGESVAFLEFESTIEEIFDVQILPGMRFPSVIGFQKETVNGAFVIPESPFDPLIL